MCLVAWKEDFTMPVLIPVLFLGGTGIVLGGGYWLLHGLHVIAW